MRINLSEKHRHSGLRAGIHNQNTMPKYSILTEKLKLSGIYLDRGSWVVAQDDSVFTSIILSLIPMRGSYVSTILI
jgi:hypothetical protein